MARNLTMWRILYVIIMCRIHKRSAPSGLRNPPHTRSLSGGYSKPQWGMKKLFFDVRSFRKRMKKWTLWTLKRHFSGWYPFTSKTEARKRLFSGPCPFNMSWDSNLFRPIPIKVIFIIRDKMPLSQRTYGSSATALRFVNNDITARGQRSYVSTAATSFMLQKLFSQHNFIKISYSDKVYQESGATENLDNALDGNTKKGLRWVPNLVNLKSNTMKNTMQR